MTSHFLLEIACLGFFVLSSLAAERHETPIEIPIPLGLIEPDIPKDNTLTREKVELGKKLFFDTSLSTNRSTSCATCHLPTAGFAEHKPVSSSASGLLLTRNAPTVLNVGYLPSLGWDGRFRSLEEQAVDPFHIWSDMGIEIDEVLDRLQCDAEYSAMFQYAFQSLPNTQTFAQALASYERTLVSGNSRFDKFLFGGNTNALNSSEREGFEVFINQANCLNCHDVFHPATNPLGARLATFTDYRFHNLGVGYDGNSMRDVGRYEQTRDPADWGAFRTPSLRNVALTAPYMHDGSLKDLREVVDFYNRGGIANRNLAPGLKPLLLSEHQKESLVAFLKALTDETFEHVN